jgi:Na+-transporting NADH:ubiquinone oxidoreductase subunit NqrD
MPFTMPESKRQKSKIKNQKVKIKMQNYDAGLAVVVHFASALYFAVPLTVATAFESIVLNLLTVAHPDHVSPRFSNSPFNFCLLPFPFSL